MSATIALETFFLYLNVIEPLVFYFIYVVVCLGLMVYGSSCSLGFQGFNGFFPHFGSFQRALPSARVGEGRQREASQVGA
jgi:hypothetical protein